MFFRKKNTPAAGTDAAAGALRVLFDEGWYRRRNPTLSREEDAWQHYWNKGAAAGLSPHPLFDGPWYLARYPDVAAAGMNPLQHYYEAGGKEHRDPCPYFDAAWYLARYPDVAAAGSDPLLHYVKFGAMELRDANPVFSAAWYVEQHPEAVANGKDPFSHFLEYGLASGHAPGPRFDARWYLSDNPDVAQAGAEPLAHYTQFGRHEGRAAASDGNDLQGMQAILERLGSLPPQKEPVRATAFMHISSMAQALATSGAAVGRILHTSEVGSAEGVLEPVVYPPHPYVAELNHAYALAGTRYLLTGADILVHDEEAFFYEDEGASVKYQKAARVGGGKFRVPVQLRQGRWLDAGINLMHEYSNNYFHFLVETLPRLILAEELEIPLEIPLLVESNLHDNLRFMLAMVNVPHRPLLRLESGTIYRVGKMYYPSDLSVIVDAYDGGIAAKRSAIDVSRIRKVVDLCRAGVSAPEPARKRRIFAARRGSLRQLTNQEEIARSLQDSGFETVYTEGLSVEDQIKIFSQADMIVGPTGAQMTNIIWAAPGARVGVLSSDHHSHQLYLWQLLGKVSGADVRMILGPRAYKITNKYSVHDDYHVDIGSVADFLSRA